MSTTHFKLTQSASVQDQHRHECPTAKVESAMQTIDGQERVEWVQKQKIIMMIQIVNNIIHCKSGIVNNIINPLPMNVLHTHMVKGILDSGIVEDGGPECYAQIPKIYQVISSVSCIVIHLLIMRKWPHTLTNEQQQRHTAKNSNLFEKVVAVNCIVSLVLTFYFKWITGKGIFIFNPCHVSLLMVAVLLLAPTTDFTRKLHTCWTTWVFGAVMALGLPHLYGITRFQVYLYYYEHLLIIPVGPIALYRRYAYVRPGFKDQMAAFSTMVIYQLGVLAPLCLATTVNLNFALCHSPADPFFKYVGYHYFTGGVIALNICSYIVRWVTYLLVWPLERYFQRSITHVIMFDSHDGYKGDSHEVKKSKAVKRQ